jgi:phosphatidylserine/phosphatidylglycerophosphate/cardiolipin synthase-like enzyme
LWQSDQVRAERMVVDRQWITVGTTNFDYRSFAHNEESNVSCLDDKLAEQLRQCFSTISMAASA